MLDRLTTLVDKLRINGVPVSTSEALDAAAALTRIPWTDRGVFRAALSATLIKNQAHLQVFDQLFDLYFSVSTDMTIPDLVKEEPTGDPDIDRFRADVLAALIEMDPRRLQELALEAVRRFAAMEPGRPVGGRYYQWKVEQALNLQDLREALAAVLDPGRGSGGSGDSAGGPSGQGGIGGRIAGDEADERIGEIKRRIEKIIRDLLIQDRGPDAMARALVKPLPEEVEFLQASSDELAEIRRTVGILARRLAARLAYKHHHANKGRLDFRRTIRASLSTGGTPIQPRYKHRTHRPEIVVLCDVSGSVAAFSRFALALLYSLSQHFRKVRSFAFVDNIDEVSSFFEGSDLEDATRRIRQEAKVVWLDGHSDYGNSIKRFAETYSDTLNPRTTVLILGDVRSNFRPAEADSLALIRSRVRKVYLLNPEPFRHWNTGDSIVASYESNCDGVYECRNLRQLSNFIERIA